MCINFGVEHNDDDVAEHFGLASPFALPQPSDYFPKQPIPILGLKPDGATRGLVAMRWGLIARDFPSADHQPQPVNAKAETVDRLSVFRECFQKRRCLIPVGHFFEWGRDHPKVRYRIQRADGQLFAAAGLWDLWRDSPSAKPILSATMVTTAANAAIGTFHHRMPAILHPHDYDLWLRGDSPLDRVKALLQPFPPELLTCTVAPPVRKPRAE